MQSVGLFETLQTRMRTLTSSTKISLSILSESSPTLKTIKFLSYSICLVLFISLFLTSLDCEDTGRITFTEFFLILSLLSAQVSGQCTEFL